MAVKSGVPVETLNSLAALLAPEAAEKILDAYWHKNGDEPTTFTINLAWRFLAIAKETKCLDDPASSLTLGTQLQLYTCNGGSNQKWTLP